MPSQTKIAGASLNISTSPFDVTDTLWNNISNVLADDGSNTSVTLSSLADSKGIITSSYGFTIPTDATIDGVEVFIERYASHATSVYDKHIRLSRAGVIEATDKSAGAALPTSATVATFGGTSDLWSAAWTAADINDPDFGVVFGVENQTGSTRSANVDYIKITIHYTNASPAPRVLPVLLDRRVELTGVYATGVTTWTMPFTDETIDAVVLGPDFGVDAYTLLTPTVSGTSVTVEGNHTDGDCYVGRLYDFKLYPTRPYVRDHNNFADVDAWVTLRQFVAAHITSGDYTLKATRDNRADRTKSHTVSATGIDDRGFTRAWFSGDAEDTVLLITSTSAKPVTIVSLEHTVDYEPRRS